MGQVVGNQFGDGKRTVDAVASVNADGQIIGSSAAPVQVAATTAIPTTDSLGGTRQHSTATGIRQAVGSTSARVALPTLSASREVYVMGTNRLFFLTGDNTVTAVNTTGTSNMSHPLAADERFYFRVPSGHTHIAYIRDSADGFITIMPVA